MDKKLNSLLGHQEVKIGGNRTAKVVVNSFTADYDSYVGICIKNVLYTYDGMGYRLDVEAVHPDDLLYLIGREIRDMEQRRVKVVASMVLHADNGTRHFAYVH